MMSRRDLLVAINDVSAFAGRAYTDGGRAEFMASVDRLLDQLGLTAGDDRARGHALVQLAVGCFWLVGEALVMEHAPLLTVHSAQRRLDHWVRELLELSAVSA